MRYLFGFVFFFVLNSQTPAADWQAVTTELLQKEKPGYGGLSGVAVDPATGNVFVELSDRGFFRSADQGKTWERLGKEVIKGRTETPGCLQIDPTGKTKRVVSGHWSTAYRLSLGTQTRTTGDSWTKSPRMWTGALWSWSDPDMKFILTLKHESGGSLLRSRDGGKSFDEVGKGYGPAWVFDADTAVATLAKSKERPKGSLVRTADGGKTFQPCAEYGPVSLPHWHDGVLYWLADGVLIKTSNKGEKWEKVGDLKDGRFGPVFGKDAKQMFALTGAGVVETTDGGVTWSKAIAIPAEMKGVSPLTWLAFDPKNDVLYVMKMTSELYKMTKR